MDSPHNHIWGPCLWMILHSSAERIGSQPLKKLPQEETRIWLNLLSCLRYSLPCPQCKKHYTSYYSSTPILHVSKEIIRTWLYNLHCQVNLRNNKSNTISLEEITANYSKPFNFSALFSIVSEQMIKALRLGLISREDYQRSIRAFQELKGFYDFF